MAFLYRRGAAGAQFEIRESESTARGPRSRTLLSFRGVLTREQLLDAQSRAHGRFDAEALAERAQALGVPVRPALEPEIRALIAKLRAGEVRDPVLLGLLRAQLEAVGVEDPAADKADVAEWVGATDAERGEALRGLLRLTDRVVASREPARARRRKRFPRIRSRRSRRAA